MRRAAALATILSLALLPQAGAATLEVSAGGGTPYQTIQAAINAAVPDVDIVLVHCGTYPENILMRDRVSVFGVNPDCTVIDGGAAGPVVRMINIGATTILQGFTITKGQSTLAGGIYIQSGSPTVSRNVIKGNRAVASGARTGYGGGIRIVPTAVNALAEDLLATTAPIISRNVIQGNIADAWGGGIEVYDDNGSMILNNLVLENTAGQGGGGIDVYLSFPKVSNNTIVRNCLQAAGASCVQGGGGISITLSGVVDVSNNVISANEAAAGGGGVDSASSTTTFTSNDSFQNLPVNYSGVSNPTGTGGNVSLDPFFEDATNSIYSPRSDSPILEAANDSLAPGDDLRGRPRPLDANADGAAHSDIGAYENDGITRLTLGPGSSSLAWDPSTSPAASYNLYRGNIQTLLQTGIYTQDTGSVPGAARQCNLPSPSATDGFAPTPGQILFYLVVVKNAVEGTLGYTSSGTLRLFTAGNRCP